MFATCRQALRTIRAAGPSKRSASETVATRAPNSPAGETIGVMVHRRSSGSPCSETVVVLARTTARVAAACCTASPGQALKRSPRVMEQDAEGRVFGLINEGKRPLVHNHWYPHSLLDPEPA